MTKKEIVLNRDVLNAIDLSNLMQYTTWHGNSQYFQAGAGTEHYRLISYLASVLKNENENENENERVPMIDIGTYTGLSALALATDTEQSVITYDIIDNIPDDDAKESIKTRANSNVK
jgi:hypothetical protein